MNSLTTINNHSLRISNIIISSVVPTTNMIFCYSVLLVVATYSGPVMNVRRNSDGTTADFYTNSTQSYLTTITGVPMTTWYAGTVSVIILYDQSGNGNHANSGSNLTLTLYNGKYVILSSAANSSKMYMTTAVSPLNLSLLFQFSDTGTGASGIHTIISTSQGYSLRLVSATASTLFGVSNINDFYMKIQ